MLQEILISFWSGKDYNITLLSVTQVIDHAWELVRLETIVNSFKECSFTQLNALRASTVADDAFATNKPSFTKDL